MAETRSGKIRCIVVTPETTVLDAEADFVAFPAYDGEVGIYPRRAPLVARLGFGELRLVNGNETTHFYIDGGFAQVRDDVVTILTASAVSTQAIKTDEVEKQLAATQTEVPTTDVAFAEKAKKQTRYRAQLHIAGRK